MPSLRRTDNDMSPTISVQVIAFAWCAPDRFEQTDPRILIDVKAPLEGLLRHRAAEEIALEGVDAHVLEDPGLFPVFDPFDNDLHAE